MPNQCPESMNLVYDKLIQDKEHMASKPQFENNVKSTQKCPKPESFTQGDFVRMARKSIQALEGQQVPAIEKAIENHQMSKKDSSPRHKRSPMKTDYKKLITIAENEEVLVFC